MSRSRTIPRLRRAVALALTGLLLAACGGSGTPDLQVGPAQAAEPVSGSSQVTVTIHNAGDGADRLLAATTPAALGIELHRTVIDDGRATMESVVDVELPPGETVRFRPGELHLMMVVPDESVVIGGTFDMTLEFERSEPITVPVEVVDLLDLAESSFEDAGS